MKKIIFSLSILAVLGACAPSSDDRPGIGPGGGTGGPTVTPAGAWVLKVGADFFSAPTNEINFKNFSANVPKKMNLYFRAPSTGQFNISKSAAGIGMNCDREKVEYKISYKHTLKTTSGISEVTPRDLAGSIDQLELKAGDELLIEMSVVSNSVCESGIIHIHATFQ